MPAQSRLHILLITTDKQRYDALGINGNRVVETTSLDALAGRGISLILSCWAICYP